MTIIENVINLLHSLYDIQCNIYDRTGTAIIVTQFLSEWRSNSINGNIDLQTVVQLQCIYGLNCFLSGTVNVDKCINIYFAFKYKFRFHRRTKLYFYIQLPPPQMGLLFMRSVLWIIEQYFQEETFKHTLLIFLNYSILFIMSIY